MHAIAGLRWIIALWRSRREANNHFHPMPSFAHKPHRATVCSDDRLTNRKTKTRSTIISRATPRTRIIHAIKPLSKPRNVLR
jgi:hypothetical protein